MTYYNGSADSGPYILLGSAEEAGVLMVLDDAKDFPDAKEKVRLFLEDHPSGGVLVVKQIVAAYRLPIFGPHES